MRDAFTLILSKTNNLYRMIFVMGIVAFVNFSFLNQSFAKNVTNEVPTKTTLKQGGYWIFRAHFFEGLKTLEVFTDVSLAKNKQILSADISDCSFCSGNEDNCAQDGIDVLELSRHPQPIIRAVCHVGAHSQRLMIFDPKKSQDKPVLTKTGAYSLSSSQQKGRLALSYDRYIEGATCPDGTENLSGYCEITENWP